MAAPRKVIITCAITGSVHTPTMSPHLPITPDEIAQKSVAAAEAGATIIHLHARNPKDGSPSPDPRIFMEFLPRIKQQTDAEAEKLARLIVRQPGLVENGARGDFPGEPLRASWTRSASGQPHRSARPLRPC